MRVLALPRYARNGASSRVRWYQYQPKLALSDIQIVDAPFFDADYIHRLYRGHKPSLAGLATAYARRLGTMARSSRFDVVWLEKELLPFVPGMVECLAARSARPIVLDMDDAWFLRYSSASPLVRLTLGRKLDALARRAALVIAGNEYIADWARSIGTRLVVQVPSVVDTSRYGRRPDHAEGPITIGWIGTPTTTPYLLALSEVLAEVCAGGGAELLVIGGAPVALPGVPLRQLPWSEETECDLLAACDIGIMPLASGLWEEGKCGYKLIQYMAAGLPVVATPVGANRRIVTPDTGFLAANLAEWRSSLLQLAADRQLRRAMGAAGRRRAEQDYSLEVWAPRLAELLQRTAGA